MINFFKAHGVSAKSAMPCQLKFVQTPMLLEIVQKYNPHSRYKPWSEFYLKLQCGYLGFYTSYEKAKQATIEDMQKSHFGINVVLCQISPCRQDLGQYCFQVTSCGSDGKPHAFVFRTQDAEQLERWLNTIQATQSFQVESY